MPFTFSHPAIVFPVRWIFRRSTSLTGLVLGSVVPDFEKFMKMNPGNSFSHAWHGIFWFNLPLAIILSFIFHLYVRNSLIENLPEFLRRRLYPYKQVNWLEQFKARYGMICLSVIIGAFSHIAWDDLTHAHGKIVRQISFLKRSVPLGEDFSMSLYSILDHLSTIGGAIFILGVILNLPVYEVRHQRSSQKIRYWGFCLLLTGLILTLRFVEGLDSGDFFEFLISSISAILISLIFTSFLFEKRKRFF